MTSWLHDPMLQRDILTSAQYAFREIIDLTRRARYFDRRTLGTMKTLLICLALSVALPCIAQEAKAKKVPQRTIQAPLKDDFAKSSLRVLKLINGETGSYDVGADGGIVGPAAVQESVDNLDADAQSKSELLVSHVMQGFLTARLTHNTYIQTISAHVGLLMVGTDDDYKATRELIVADKVAKTPSVIAMKEKESACSTQIETLLRLRKFQDIPECSHDALSVSVN